MEQYEIETQDELAEKLKEKGVQTALYDLARTDLSFRWQMRSAMTGWCWHATLIMRGFIP